MVKFVLPLAAALALVSSVTALPVPSSSWPESKGTVSLVAPQVVKAGETFDGGMKTYELANVQCSGQKETSKNTMVFLVEPGATLKNVIIGKNQAEGVHCEKHDCTIENVWWTDVCEDALSIKGGSASSVSKVIGGGARYADDKVVQHNGPGTVTIDGFFAQDFGKLYRSCGTCGDVKRKVEISNVLAINPKSGIATVNKNYGDEAKISNIHIESTKKKVAVCSWSQGVAKGEGEPGKLGDGPSPPLCQYSESDIVLNGSASSGNSTTTAAPVTEAPVDDDADTTEEPATEAPVDGDDETDATEAPVDGDDETDATDAPVDDDDETDATDAPADGDDETDATDAPADGDDETDATDAPADGDDETDATEAPVTDDDEYATPAPASGDDEYATPAPASDDDEESTPAPASDDDNEDDDDDSKSTKKPKKVKTPKPSKAPKSPKPSKAPKTPKPSKSPKPSKAPKTPKPSKDNNDDEE